MSAPREKLVVISLPQSQAKQLVDLAAEAIERRREMYQQFENSQQISSEAAADLTNLTTLIRKARQF